MSALFYCICSACPIFCLVGVALWRSICNLQIRCTTTIFHFDPIANLKLERFFLDLFECFCFAFVTSFGCNYFVLLCWEFGLMLYPSLLLAASLLGSVCVFATRRKLTFVFCILRQLAEVFWLVCKCSFCHVGLIANRRDVNRRDVASRRFSLEHDLLIAL